MSRQMPTTLEIQQKLPPARFLEGKEFKDFEIVNAAGLATLAAACKWPRGQTNN